MTGAYEIWSEFAARRRPLAVLGNGPSLRGFDFADELAGFDTIGMNAAYRYWEQIGWYPNYYICLDLVVGLSHIDAIADLVQNRVNNRIRKFILRGNAAEALSDRGVDCIDVIDFDAIRLHPMLSDRWVTTGSHAALVGACLGYEAMALLGIDADYVERVEGSVERDGVVLEIAEERENPNYFFAGYQRVGDRYNIPNPTPGLHENAWTHAAQALADAEILVLNTNPTSRLQCFTKVDFRRAKPDLFAAAQDRYHHPQALSVHLPEIDRSQMINVDETSVVFDLAGPRGNRDNLMIDVGAHYGSSASPFAGAGWKVVCFEPDPANRKRLLARFHGSPNVKIDGRALTQKRRGPVDFYTSQVSTGISSIHAFDESHVRSARVDTTDLEAVVDEYSLDRIDFLKIDAEGADFEILQGFPWSRLRPGFIVAKFEDRKTVTRGITYRDLCDLLERQNYVVYVSEWHPIVTYGRRHSWHRVFRYRRDEEVLSDDAWGNVIAVCDEIEVPDLVLAFSRNLRRPAVQNAEEQATDVRPRHLQHFVGWFFRRLAAYRWQAVVALAVLLCSASSSLLGRSSNSLFGSIIAVAVLLSGALVTVWQYAKWSRRSTLHTKTRASASKAGLGGADARSDSVDTGVPTDKGDSRHSSLRTPVRRSGPRADLVEFSVWALGFIRRRRIVLPSALVISSGLLGLVVFGGPAISRLSTVLLILVTASGSLAVGVGYLKARQRQTVDVLGQQIDRLGLALAEQAAAGSAAEARLESLVEDMARRDSIRLGRTRTVAPILLDPDVEALKDWGKRLGLDLTVASLHYLARRVPHLEGRLHGRLAATVPTQVVRNLCGLSLSRRTNRLRVLEIGTLFGTGLASLHDACSPYTDDVRFVVIDPLHGYYGQVGDVMTNLPVTEHLFWTNMRLAGMSDDAVQLIQRSSQDREVVEQVASQEFDLAILDGDHSYHGVESDFNAYRSSVRVRGLMIFDDYGNPDWPDVTDFVDAVVMKSSDFELVGHGFFSAVFRRVP